MIALFCSIIGWIGVRSCAVSSHSDAPLSSSPTFIVAPHFMRHADKVAAFYAMIAQQIPQPEHIVILSPNHFDLGVRPVESVHFFSPVSVCYRSDCVSMQSLGSTMIGSGFGRQSFSSHDDVVYPLGNQRYIRDHGIGEHFQWINTFAPQATIYPLLLGSGNPLATIAMLSGFLHENPKTLVIASVDFSHYIPDQRSQLHDDTARFTLYDASGGWSDFRSLEVDCPACLYTVHSLAQNFSQSPSLWRRDASDAGWENTSRQFWSYHPDSIASGIISPSSGNNASLSGFTLAWFGDMMRTRGVADVLNTPAKRDNYFRDFFQQRDSNNNLTTHRHRLLAGIDIVGGNLETGLTSGATKEGSPTLIMGEQSHDRIILQSDGGWIPWWKSLGFTVFNLANNHSLVDSNQTRDILDHYDMNYIGQMQNEPLHPLYQTIRGQRIALWGIDQTIMRKPREEICEALAESGVVHIVSVHRGKEYESISPSQREYGRFLVDCGAQAVIGHHPHIVQDIERYQGKPIAYSLGNFLFDQTRPGTQTGVAFLMTRTVSGVSASYYPVSSSVLSP